MSENSTSRDPPERVILIVDSYPDAALIETDCEHRARDSAADDGDLEVRSRHGERARGVCVMCTGIEDEFGQNTNNKDGEKMQKGSIVRN